VALGLTVAAAPAAQAKPLSVPWPPVPKKGAVFVHFGEEHVNDADGATLLPKVVAESIRYRPDLVTMSGDKADDGAEEQLGLWLAVMKAYDRAGIPWFAGIGNHDRKAPPGSPGGIAVLQDFSIYQDFFAPRPWPMGDGAPYGDPIVDTGPRPPGDPEGAATHYFVDAGPVRWIFIDNSCWSITVCETPGFKFGSGQQEGGESQFDFLERVASAAQGQGRLAFVVMHMPTQDPRDQSYADPTSVMHTMGKGPAGTLDNTLFEQAADSGGVDGVFVGHIKGQFRYSGQGGVPYFIDGGAGGELYTTGPVGVDHGYWHGFRLIRVRGGDYATEVVPIFVRKGIRIEGPRKLRRGAVGQWAACGRQPVFNDPAKVPSLELRDPDPVPSGSALGFADLGDGIWFLLPLLLIVAVGLVVHRDAMARGGLVVALAALVGAGSLTGGVSIAQQSEPTSTPPESLPVPSRIWTSSNASVLRAVPAAEDDKRRNRRTQTDGGRFRARCPGRARLEIASGFAFRQRKVTVRSAPGGIVRSIKPLGGLVDGPTPVAAVQLSQPARVRAVVLDGGRRVALLRRRCFGAGTVTIGWNGHRGRRGRGRALDPGAYEVAVSVLSDRRPRREVLEVVVR
jgi:hypothetical protein